MQARGLECSSETRSRTRRSRRATRCWHQTRGWQQLRPSSQQCLHAAGAQRTSENLRERERDRWVESERESERETGGVRARERARERQVGCPPLLFAPPFPPLLLFLPPFFLRVIFFLSSGGLFWRAGGAQRLKEVCRNTERAREQESGTAGERETAALASAFLAFCPPPFSLPD